MMNPEIFIKAIREEVLINNQKIYEDLLNNTPVSDATDSYWIDLLNLYSDMNSDQKKILLQVMRQVSSDTISNIFGILDGVSCIDNLEDEFDLKYSGITINGDLQDLFLELEEE